MGVSTGRHGCGGSVLSSSFKYQEGLTGGGLFSAVFDCGLKLQVFVFSSISRNPQMGHRSRNYPQRPRLEPTLVYFVYM